MLNFGQNNMATLSSNYPRGCTEEQIITVIDDLSKDILASGGNINTVLRLSPIIALGQSELQKRVLESSHLINKELHAEVKRLSDITNKNTISSEKYANASKFISLVALILSLLSIAISIYFSVQLNTESDIWRHEEINLLQKILNK